MLHNNNHNIRCNLLSDRIEAISRVCRSIVDSCACLHVVMHSHTYIWQKDKINRTIGRRGGRWNSSGHKIPFRCGGGLLCHFAGQSEHQTCLPRSKRAPKKHDLKIDFWSRLLHLVSKCRKYDFLHVLTKWSSQDQKSIFRSCF